MKYDNGEYSLKNVKTFKGMEEMGGFNADLYRGKKKVVGVINDDSGGETMFHWFDTDVEQVEITNIDNNHTFKGTPEEKLLYEYCFTLPKWKSEFDGKEFHITPDIFVGEMVNGIMDDKEVKKDLRKYYIFVVDGEIRQIPTKHKGQKVSVKGITNHLIKKYGDGKFLLLNTAPFEVAKKHLVG